MSIDTQLYLLSGGLAVGALFAAWQAFKLRSVYRSKSSWIGAITFLLMGARQVYSFLRLRSNIAQARMRGTMIDHLTAEQWIVAVLWAYVILAGFIFWQHLKHREIERLLGEN